MPARARSAVSGTGVSAVSGTGVSVIDGSEQALRLGAFGIKTGRGGPGGDPYGGRIIMMVLRKSANRRRGARIQRQAFGYHGSHDKERGWAGWQTKAAG